MTEDVQDYEIEQPVEAKPSAGAMLAEARERLELSVADVARQLRLSPRQIEALEADDYARLPGKTFLRGFIRNYAKLLQLDPEPLLAGCQEAQPVDQQSIVVPTSRIEFGGKPRFLPFSDRPQRQWPKLPIAIAAVVLLLSWGAYELIQWQQQPSSPSEPAKAESETTLSLALPPPKPETAVQPPEAPAAKPAAEAVPLPLPGPAEAKVAEPAPASAPAPAPAPQAAVVGGKRLSFMFEGDSWVEVRDKNGKIVFSQLNLKGSQQTISGVPPFSLVVGNAAHVRVTYNDKPVDLAPYVKVDVARLTLE